MKASTMECTGYKRLNFSSLNMTSEKIGDKSVENITPVKWSKEVLSGERQIVIKKK